MRWLVSMLGFVIACGSEDAHRCGSPPVDCLGGACLNGQCSAWRLTTSPDFPTALTVDGDDIDWVTQSGELFSVSKAGGPSTDVMHVTGYAVAVAASPSSIYVGSPLDGLLRVERSTHDLITLDTASALAVTTNVIGDVTWAAAPFFGPSSGAGIKRQRSGTSTTEALAPGEASAVVAIDDVGTYWIDGMSSGWGCSLGNDPCQNAQFPVRARFADGTFATYAAATASADCLAADGSALYVADWCAGTVTRIEHADAASTVIARGLAWPGAIVVDDTSVYLVLITRCSGGFWATTTGSSALVRIPKDGGATSTLRTIGQGVSAIAQDDATLYYLATDHAPDASATHEAVFAIAKPVP